jgi:hypothetical protein
MLTAQYAIDLEAEGFTVFAVSPGVSNFTVTDQCWLVLRYADFGSG